MKVLNSSLKDAPSAKRIKIEVKLDKKASGGSSEQIKQSHLQLDDIPPELLPKHHENMLKRVSI